MTGIRGLQIRWQYGEYLGKRGNAQLLFNSVEFLIFFSIVTVLYFLVPFKFKWVLLLAASCVFYMFFIPEYIIILGFSLTVSYFACRLMDGAQGTRRRLFLILTITFNVAILFVFKYFNFFNANIARVAEAFHWNYGISSLSIILPIGLSFYTFQNMGYIIDVYRGNQKRVKHFGIYALFILFYPQLVAGPIERSKNLLHQFMEDHPFDYFRVTDGLKLMLWGMFKKVVIADNLAVIVNNVYNDPGKFTGLPLIIATYFFAFQIYCDFSGYTDIARGCARVMGFELMENFKQPYLSRSVPEFWKRWHISLSSWFKDYVYIPLGGSRVRRYRWFYNIMVVFLLSGLWHGASWTYVIWGGLNGIYQVVSIMTVRIRGWFVKALRLDRLPLLRKTIQIFITFHLVLVSWVFFRAGSISDAAYIIKHLFDGISLKGALIPGVSKGSILFACAMILFLLIIQLLQTKNRMISVINSKPVLLRWGICYAAVLFILLFGEFSSTEFIYFQF